jgi:hypothetical protein
MFKNVIFEVVLKFRPKLLIVNLTLIFMKKNDRS